MGELGTDGEWIAMAYSGYHSGWNKDDLGTVCGMAMCPITTKFKGPSPQNTTDRADIIDEALKFFKANVLFRNFEVRGAADKTLIYLTLFISEALQKMPGNDLKFAQKEMHTLGITDFWTPSHKQWPLAGFTTKPANRAEADKTRQWLAQLRQECGLRLCEKVFKANPNVPDKWWMCFVKKKFMNMALFDERNR